jgi:ribonuclease D
MSSFDVLIITTDAVLDEWCETLEKEDSVAVDTEGDSLHCYFEKLCLIQISSVAQNVLIDPFESLNFSRFKIVLAKRRIVLHGCDYDLRMLRRGIKFTPGEVFDTYLAARLVGLKEVGLASLVKEFFGIDLPKSSQKANWAKRPLTETMIEYAINDTLYLLELAESLTERLHALGRWSWFQESCAKAISAAALDREKDPERVWKVPGSSKLEGLSLAVLKVLWHWRDEEAKNADRPSFQVLRNEEMLELAKSAAQARLRIPQSIQGSRRKRLNNALEKALALPESEWPHRIKFPVKKPTAEEEQRFEHLKNRRDRVAMGLNLDPAVVAPRQALEKISREPQGVFSALMPWQRQLLGL